VSVVARVRFEAFKHTKVVFPRRTSHAWPCIGCIRSCFFDETFSCVLYPLAAPWCCCLGISLSQLGVITLSGQPTSLWAQQWLCLYATSGGSAYHETGAATNNFGVVREEIFHEKRGLETRLTRYGQGKGWLAMAFKNSSSY
jgi:hypothetical protein